MYELQMALDRFPSPVDAVFEAKSFNTVAAFIITKVVSMKQH